MRRHHFHAMGTWVECLVEAPPSPALDAAFERIEIEFERLEQILSRFRHDSELSRLNRERSIEASDELLELTRLALDAREETGGRFDPTLHDALITAGYDRTFTDLCNETRTPGRVATILAARRPIESPPVRGGGVRIRGARIELGDGASLDLGGIAKGWAADRCVAWLADFWPAVINAGGDIAVSGPRSDGPWPVGVDVPGGALTLAVGRGGLATSGRERRRWIRDGEERHHIIDPRTGRPARGTPLSVTVTAPTATAAEVRAKALFLAGPGAAREAASADLSAVITWENGETELVGIADPGVHGLTAAA